MWTQLAESDRFLAQIGIFSDSINCSMSDRTSYFKQTHEVCFNIFLFAILFFWNQMYTRIKKISALSFYKSKLFWTLQIDLDGYK